MAASEETSQEETDEGTGGTVNSKETQIIKASEVTDFAKLCKETETQVDKKLGRPTAQEVIEDNLPELPVDPPRTGNEDKEVA